MWSADRPVVVRSVGRPAGQPAGRSVVRSVGRSRARARSASNRRPLGRVDLRCQSQRECTCERAGEETQTAHKNSNGERRERTRETGNTPTERSDRRAQAPSEPSDAARSIACDRTCRFVGLRSPGERRTCFGEYPPIADSAAVSLLCGAQKHRSSCRSAAPRVRVRATRWSARKHHLCLGRGPKCRCGTNRAAATTAARKGTFQSHEGRGVAWLPRRKGSPSAARSRAICTEAPEKRSTATRCARGRIRLLFCRV